MATATTNDAVQPQENFAALFEESLARQEMRQGELITAEVTRVDYNIVVVNAGEIRVTGAKLTDKFYHQHTGYVGNLKSIALGKLLKEHPERAIEFAVKGMLPKGPLGRRMYKKLHVFGGNTHPHQAQQPKALEL